MPLIVRELVIRATVEQGTPRSSEEANEEASEKKGARERQTLIVECVDQVLEILARREGR